MSAAPHFGRVATAMVTPFDADLNIDERHVALLAEYLISHGTETLVVAGTTGESATLTHDEKRRLFQIVKATVGDRAKVIAGTGTNNTADSIALTREAEEIGVDGVLLVTPYYNKPSQAGLYAHYRAVAEVTSLPVMLYNVPGRTSINLQAATAIRLAQDCANIIAVKEASKDLEQIADIAAAAPPHFQIYSGDDGTTLPILALGGVGVVSVTAHVNGPQLHKMHEAFFRNDLNGARALFLKSMALTRALFITSNPVPVKTALALLDVLPDGRVRLPLVEANEQERSIIHTALRDYGLL